MAFHEHHSRSLAKTITYRVLIIITHAITLYYVTRRWDLTWHATTISAVSSTIIYFLHERFWNRIHWGKMHIK